jgi:DNA-directed RNA polymerase subunit RPC12/RpoP
MSSLIYTLLEMRIVSISTRSNSNMNWITKSYVADKSAEKKTKIAEECDLCEHLEEDINKMHRVHYEQDCCGPVSGYAVCEACDAKIEEQEDNQEYTCHDCGQEFKRKDGVLWKGFYFEESDGDEPTPVCGECSSKEKHLKRRQQWRDDYNFEVGPPDEESF